MTMTRKKALEYTGLTVKQIYHAAHKLGIKPKVVNATQFLYTKGQLNKIVAWNKKYGRTRKGK